MKARNLTHATYEHADFNVIAAAAMTEDQFIAEFEKTTFLNEPNVENRKKYLKELYADCVAEAKKGTEPAKEVAAEPAPAPAEEKAADKPAGKK